MLLADNDIALSCSYLPDHALLLPRPGSLRDGRRRRGGLDRVPDEVALVLVSTTCLLYYTTISWVLPLVVVSFTPSSAAPEYE